MTTARDHAQIYRKIINLNNGGQPLVCMFADCEKHAFQNFTVLEHKHPGAPSDRRCQEADWIADGAAHIRYPFCSERHKTMFVESSGWRTHRLMADRGHAFGYLPTGSRGMMS